MTVKRLISVTLAVVMLIAAMSAFALPAAAAEPAVKERKGVALRNVKTGQYLNYDYGTLKNGQPLRVWPWDGSQEQLFAIDHVSGNDYRILTDASAEFAVDVYRGNSKLKLGQACDIWKAGDDSVAQNIVFHRCDDGSYILRMSNNPSLVLGATVAKGRVRLLKFNANDASQKWVFQDADGNRIDIAKTDEADAVTVPDSVYELSQIYCVDGRYYSLATTTQEYNAVPVGTQFYVDSETRGLVTDTEILGKIVAIQTFNNEREALSAKARSHITDACEYLDEYTDIKGLSKIGTLVGKGAAAYIDFLKLFLAKQIDAKGLMDGVKSFGSLLLEAAAIEERLEIKLVMTYTERTVDSGIAMMEATLTPMTDYEAMMKAFDDYATCEAAFAVVRVLTADTLAKDKSRSLIDKILKGTLDATSAVADVAARDLFGDLSDIKKLAKIADTLAITKTAKDKITLINKGADLAIESIDSGDFYIRARNQVLKSAPVGDGSLLANNAVKLIDRALALDPLVGKTIASIRKNGSYTKWYGASENVSAKKGYTGQCTWYALGRFYEVTGVKLTTAPHAKYWLVTNMADKKVKVVYGAASISSQSIAVNIKGEYGHVLFVEHVTYDANGKPQYVYFTECNIDGNGVYNVGKDCILKKMTYSKFVSQKKPAGYITAR